MFPWASLPDDDEAGDPANAGVRVNHYGFKQLTNDLGEDVCIGCTLPYTNKSEGMLCHVCQHLLRNHMEEFE
jgi:hypothetical protein